MAANFIGAGHEVSVVVRRDEAAAPFVAMGARRCDVAELARHADVVFTLVPRGAGHEALYFGAGGLLEVLAPGTLLVDCATAAPEMARRAAAAAATRGLRFVDAPISGGVRGAVNGTLTFIAGGEAADVEALRAVTQGVAAELVHLGPAGCGQAAKICNNLVVGAVMAATCESFALAEELGLDAAQLFQVMSRSSARSWVLENLCPVPGVVPHAPSSHGYRPGGQSRLMLKDLGLASETAAALEVAAPMTAAARSLYQMFCNQGHGGVDVSGLIRMLQGEPLP